MTENNKFLDLANKVRPFKISQMYPTCDKLPTLQQLSQENNAPKLSIFYGLSGCGKSTGGRIMAMALSCTAEGEKPCGVCDNCKYVRMAWEKDQEIDGSCIYINAAKMQIEDMRKVIDRVMSGRLNPIGKVAVLIEEAHNITAKAKELLLDPTENSPKNVHWMLMTTDIGSLPIALTRRANKYEFTALSPQKSVALVQTTYKSVTDKDLSTDIAERIINGLYQPGFFLKELEEYLLSGENTETLPKLGFKEAELESPKSAEDRVSSNFLKLIGLFSWGKPLTKVEVYDLMKSVVNDIISQEITNAISLRFRIIATIKTMIGKRLASPALEASTAILLPAYADILRILCRDGDPFAMQGYNTSLLLADIISCIERYGKV